MEDSLVLQPRESPVMDLHGSGDKAQLLRSHLLLLCRLESQHHPGESVPSLEGLSSNNNRSCCFHFELFNAKAVVMVSV